MLIPNLSSRLAVGIVSLRYMKGWIMLSRAWRSLGGFSSLRRRFPWWHSAGKAGDHRALLAFPQRFLWLRKLPSKCPFLHTLFSQQNLTAYAEVGFTTGKIKLDILKSSQFSFFNHSPPAGRNISTLQYKRV